MNYNIQPTYITLFPSPMEVYGGVKSSFMEPMTAVNRISSLDGNRDPGRCRTIGLQIHP